MGRDITNGEATALLHRVGDDATNSFDEPSNTSSLTEKRTHRIKSVFKPISLALLTAGLVNNPFNPPASHASAPIVMQKKYEAPDIKGEALKAAKEEQAAIKEGEVEIHRLKCEEIEAEKGKAARDAYDAEYQVASKKRAEEKVIQGKKLLYDLADQGICPFTDVEGQRQLCLREDGYDLSRVPGTAQQQEMMMISRPKHIAKREKQRFIIKCIVDDIKLKGEDPVEYLQNNMEKSIEVQKYPDGKLNAVFTRYEAIIAQRGSLSGIKADTPFDASTAIYGVNTKGSKQKKSKVTKEAKADAKMDATTLKMEAK